MIHPFSTVAELITALEAGSTTSRALCDMYLARIASKNGVLRAITAVRDVNLIYADADASDERRVTTGPISEFDGIPFSLKLNIGTKDVLTWNGADKLTMGEESDVAMIMRGAGMVLLAKDNGPGAAAFTVTSKGGATANPFNLAYAGGGSSGGSAASVAAGFVPVSVGADSAGSLRIPASFNGVYTIKPSHGVVSQVGDWGVNPPSRPPYHSMDLYGYGPLTRSIGDLKLMLALLARPTPRWPTGRYLRPTTAPVLHKLIKVNTIGVWNLTPGHEQATLDTLCSDLAIGGVEVVVKNIPSSVYNEAIFNKLYKALCFEPSGLCKPYAPPVGQQFSETPWNPASLTYLENSKTHNHGRVHQDWLQRYVHNELIGDADGLIMGATALPPPLLGVYPGSVPFMAMTSIFNVTGNPAVVLPAAQRPNGLPSGIQLVGRIGEDYDLLDTAEQVNAYLPGFTAPNL